MSITNTSHLVPFELVEKGDTNALRFLAQHSEGTKSDVTSGGEPTEIVVVYLPCKGRETKEWAN